ncbi:hypothetical protein IHE44_0001325 [Lamprotornis superbus]|uniref:Uncharacterized protein n=1 Tax=Lamprotornis superbus TaxID=245042 RepID=A0A835NDF4_9PASS|nr:hypothetical protein IHE44_0001325 [Lamprotornis superbus]
MWSCCNSTKLVCQEWWQGLLADVATPSAVAAQASQPIAKAKAKATRDGLSLGIEFTTHSSGGGGSDNGALGEGGHDGSRQGDQHRGRLLASGVGPQGRQRLLQAMVVAWRVPGREGDVATPSAVAAQASQAIAKAKAKATRDGLSLGIEFTPHSSRGGGSDNGALGEGGHDGSRQGDQHRGRVDDDAGGLALQGTGLVAAVGQRDVATPSAVAAQPIAIAQPIAKAVAKATRDGLSLGIEFTTNSSGGGGSDNGVVARTPSWWCQRVVQVSLAVVATPSAIAAQATQPIAKSTAIAKATKSTKSSRDGLSLHTEFSAHGSRGGGSDNGALGEGGHDGSRQGDQHRGRVDDDARVLALQGTGLVAAVGQRGGSAGLAEVVAGHGCGVESPWKRRG